MPKFLLTENSKIIIPLFTLLSVIGFIIVSTYSFTTWKTESEQSMVALQLDLDRTKADLLQSNLACTTINENQDNEIQIIKLATVNNATSMVEIQTDIKWIRAFMEGKIKD